uniref:Sorting nexin 24 n=1 Tax=Pavo cristatus TaxID=9049 RepID=A0A8C9L521_PAVCR
MEVYIPSFRYEESELERGYTVSRAAPGRARPARAREGLRPHRLRRPGRGGRLKKCIRTPEIPSKHVRNWVPKVLEQRRQGLELYLQVISFHFNCSSFDETESEESSKLSHQPVLLFLRDPYVLPKANDDFPNVVIEGILHGIFYPHLLPR